MAKMFYTLEEASEKLGKGEDELKDLVRAGKLREFRDAGSFNYKVDEIDRLAKESGNHKQEAAPKAEAPPKPPEQPRKQEEAPGDDLGGSGEILLEPVDEDSSIELSGGDTGEIRLDEAELEGTASGTASGTAAETASGSTATEAEKAKGDTVVPSAGVNVFDDEDLDEHVDPLAQTAVTDVGGLGLEGVGSGSGILDLTRESDDTSLGQELLDEIYTDEEKKEAAEKAPAEDMGEDTRAGLEEAPAEEGETEAVAFEAGTERAPARATVREVVEYGPDAASTALTAGMIVAVAVMWIGGLGSAALVRDVMPGLIQAIYPKLWMYAAGALGAAVIAGAVTFLVARKKSGS